MCAFMCVRVRACIVCVRVSVLLLFFPIQSSELSNHINFFI